MAKNSLNLQDFGPVSSFSTSIISGLLVGLLIQYFIIGIYDGSRRMWQISKKIEGK